ncbi:MAG: oligosaccharide flippase family protein [Planctomycetaceae bacterium]
MPQAASLPRASFVADRLASGLVVMLIMTIFQRGIGFARGVWFCRLLDDTVVGQWSMAFGFITMITPLMMLGLPGAMPRYVERYRLAGQLPKFLQMVVLGTLLGSVLVIFAMIAMPNQFGWLIFREASSVWLTWSVVGAIATVLIFNFVNELVSSLRQVRTVSLMQFVQGIGFTVFGLTALYAGGGLQELVIAFGLSMAIGTVPGIRVLARDWSGLPQSDEAFDCRDMWRRLLPYAAALWAMNLLSNTFEMSDRYMILHLMPGDETAAKAAVGQYHSGRLIPTLLTSLATMFAGVLLPYLSADWEQGKTDAVKQRLRHSLFGLSVGFTACAAVALTISPWLFDVLLQGRYRDGLVIQPMAFTLCIWAAIVTVAQNYLWVRERGHLIGGALAVGLAANLFFNGLWLPHWGLQGAVWATLVANGIVLVGVGWALRRVDYRLDTTALWVAILPLTLMAGGSIAMAAALACLVLNRDAHDWLSQTIDPLWSRSKLRTMGFQSVD